MTTESSDYTGRATYSPEDNKLRLYIGRVPRDEYEKLRAEGWKALHKQREAGGGDFVATWTPERRDTALEYAGIIEDEDMGPAERAADRAERFAGYREKRTDEATARADRFDAKPAAHGFQSSARAERAAARHDRIAGRAVDAWGKAEYWQRRTAGVISHALHVSSPGVRMGRIKELEAELRRFERNPDHYADWINHTRLRIAYENQMIEAQGGRAASLEIEVGGKWGGLLIMKVCKSPATGRVTSIFAKGPKVNGWQYMTKNVLGADYSLHQFETERASMDHYTPPTPESLAELAATKAATKAAAPKKEACPLVNPTDAEAERLQEAMNQKVRERWARRAKESPYSYNPTPAPSQVLRITQAAYSAHSGGAHSAAKTSSICRGAVQEPTSYNYDGRYGAPVCKVRTTSGESYAADRVIILTDKPQKPLPVAVWEAYAPAATHEAVNA